MSEHAEYLEAITAHVERHFGPVESVLHEIVSDELHIDVLMVPPTEARPCITLVTSGMSGRAMDVPADVDAPRYAELVLTLLPGYPLDHESFDDEAVYWPIRKLKQAARWPMQLATWFGDGHTMSTNPPEPMAPGVPFVGIALLELLDPAARRLQVEGGPEIAFYQLVALHPEELQEKIDQGPQRLHELFDSEALRHVYNTRTNLCSREHVDRYVRGGKWIVLAGWLMALLVVADFGAAWLDGAKLPWTRLGFGIATAAYVAQGKRWARWFTLVPCFFIPYAMYRFGFGAATESVRVAVIYASLPIWLGIVWLLFGSASVRWRYFADRVSQQAKRS
ncbi:MAG: hypothetical protein RL398_43 [Planctomycetota bacterium]